MAWLPSSWPSRTICRSTSLRRPPSSSTCPPMTKNVARAPCSRSSRSISGVWSDGASSMVSATTRRSAGRPSTCHSTSGHRRARCRSRIVGGLYTAYTGTMTISASSARSQSVAMRRRRARRRSLVGRRQMLVRVSIARSGRCFIFFAALCYGWFCSLSFI
ncbi:hypothetical protein ACKVWC_011568 [Pyricularia oryzae]